MLANIFFLELYEMHKLFNYGKLRVQSKGLPLYLREFSYVRRDKRSL